MAQPPTNPLSLFMPVIPGADLAKIAAALATAQGDLDAALNSVGTVHFARFLFLDTSKANLQPDLNPASTSQGPFIIGVVTEYDGDFDAYIQDFVNKVGPIFDLLLGFVVGGAALVPVANNVQDFTNFIALNDASQHAPNQGLYQAYPQTVQQIKAKFPPTS
jgi:hypothetical protein